MRVSEIIRRAVEIGERYGTVTFDELNQLCTREIQPEDIENILSALSDAGIDVVEER